MSQRLLLALDASAPCSALALGWVPDDETDGTARLLAGDERIDGANQASATLDHRIQALFETVPAEHRPLKLEQLDLLACGRGPGTFTGTRVALATAQGLACAIGCACVSLTTLDALAWSLHAQSPQPDGSLLTALLDARRGEVYARSFVVSDGELTAIDEPHCVGLESYLRGLPQAPRFAVGPGVEPYRALLPDSCERLETSSQLQGPSAQGLWLAAITSLRRDGSHEVQSLQPLYLRATYAELGINKPKRERYVSPFV